MPLQDGDATGKFGGTLTTWILESNMIVQSINRSKFTVTLPIFTFKGQSFQYEYKRSGFS